MTITEYTDLTTNALKENHPRNYPAYKDDPIACWRYVCRCYGVGLAPYTDKEIQNVVPSLYNRWFIALDFTSRRPNINAKQFNGWIWNAAREVRNAQNHTT